MKKQKYKYINYHNSLKKNNNQVDVLKINKGCFMLYCAVRKESLRG